jgi:hypothetical protein
MLGATVLFGPFPTRPRCDVAEGDLGPTCDVFIRISFESGDRCEVGRLEIRHSDKGWKRFAARV